MSESHDGEHVPDVEAEIEVGGENELVGAPGVGEAGGVAAEGVPVVEGFLFVVFYEVEED